MIPYAQKIVSDYLRTHPDVSAITDRIVSKKPKDTDEDPWVQVRQLDAQNAPNSIPEHLIDFLFQLDCYADFDGGRPQAIFLGRTVRAALTSMNGSIGGAVVTGARIVGDSDQPDPDLTDRDGGSRDRKILTVIVWMHA